MSSIDPASRPTEAFPPAGGADEAAPDPEWQARLEALNRGPGEPTALERHVQFFDTNKDRQLSVKEVREGLERLGMESWWDRVVASTVNNALLGPPTRDRLITFKIDIDEIEKAKHEGSNTGIFGPDGHFVPEKFEEMFGRFDKDRDGRLTASEIKTMVAVNTIGASWRGKFSAEAEFDLMLELCAYEDEKGERYMTKDRMLRFYDGRLFDEIAAEVKLYGKMIRHPVPGHVGGDDAGALPRLARSGAGPAAGPAAGAAFGESLLTAETAGTAPAAGAVLGGMLAVCPYAGMLAGQAETAAP